MAQTLLLPFIGLLMFAFTMGVRRFYLFDTVGAEITGVIVGSALVVPLCFLRRVKPLLPFIYQVLVPVFVLILIILNSFPKTTMPMIWAAHASYVFFGAMMILAVASLCAMAHAREFSPTLIFSICVTCEARYRTTM